MAAYAIGEKLILNKHSNKLPTIFLSLSHLLSLTREPSSCNRLWLITEIYICSSGRGKMSRRVPSAKWDIYIPPYQQDPRGHWRRSKKIVRVTCGRHLQWKGPCRAWPQSHTQELTVTVHACQDLHKIKAANILAWVDKGLMESYPSLRKHWQLKSTKG